MARQRITKEMVVNAAFELARAQGLEQVVVKGIAEKLDCSVQPIYSYCENMDHLRKEVMERAGQFVRDYVGAHIDPEDLFHSTGKAYLQVAMEEPHIFTMFLRQERRNVSSFGDLYRLETNPQVAKEIADRLGIREEQARQLHLHMLVYNIGLGVIYSASIPGIPAEEVILQQEAAYQVFLNHVLEGKENVR